MAATIIIGAQWGDEGKGKAVDVFSSQADFVVRYQGGANAGHTLNVDGQKTVLHLLPSGILHKHTVCVISSGVVLDLFQLCQEILALKKSGVSIQPGQLHISDSCTILLSYHKALDQAREKKAALDKIGTTGKGIGPAYEDRASRKAILFGDIFGSAQFLKKKVEASLLEKNHLLKELYGGEVFDADKVVDEILNLRDFLAPYRCKDVSLLLHEALVAKKKVLFEGAQGTLLDVLHGTYPFVTSSSTLAGSCCFGVGLGPQAISQVIGISKAYATRVGSGPFPSEMDDIVGELFLERGQEFGATTGRKRRCGWLDLVALKYAVRVNGLTQLAIMKLDVLSGLEKIRVCTSYLYDGEQYNDYPPSTKMLESVSPVYEEFPGWSEDISQCKDIEGLPVQAHSYLEFISDFVGVPICVVSVGPDRSQTIWSKSLFVSDRGLSY